MTPRPLTEFWKRLREENRGLGYKSPEQFVKACGAFGSLEKPGEKPRQPLNKKDFRDWQATPMGPTAKYMRLLRLIGVDVVYCQTGERLHLNRLLPSHSLVLPRIRTEDRGTTRAMAKLAIVWDAYTVLEAAKLHELAQAQRRKLTPREFSTAFTKAMARRARASEARVPDVMSLSGGIEMYFIYLDGWLPSWTGHFYLDSIIEKELVDTVTLIHETNDAVQKAIAERTKERRVQLHANFPYRSRSGLSNTTTAGSVHAVNVTRKSA